MTIAPPASPPKGSSHEAYVLYGELYKAYLRSALTSQQIQRQQPSKGKQGKVGSNSKATKPPAQSRATGPMPAAQRQRLRTAKADYLEAKADQVRRGNPRVNPPAQTQAPTTSFVQNNVVAPGGTSNTYVEAAKAQPIWVPGRLVPDFCMRCQTGSLAREELCNCPVPAKVFVPGKFEHPNVGTSGTAAQDAPLRLTITDGDPDAAARVDQLTASGREFLASQPSPTSSEDDTWRLVSMKKALKRRIQG